VTGDQLGAKSDADRVALEIAEYSHLEAHDPDYCLALFAVLL